LNLTTSTGDDPDAVAANRRRVSDALGIPEQWATLNPVHGCRAVLATDPALEGDALITDGPRPVAVLVADCIPVAIVGRSRSAVAHAGWRGLVSGVVEEALKILDDQELKAWIGPGIGPCHYEVGPELPRRFAESYPDAPSFSIGNHFDLPGATRWVLRCNGVEVGEDPVPCTFCDPNFYSFRRDGVTGRQAVVVWR
jgi:YfiH family protein